MMALRQAQLEQEGQVKTEVKEVQVEEKDIKEMAGSFQ